MHLPQKIEALRKATIFNKKTREYALNELKKDKRYLKKCLNEDIHEHIIFRNYQDYLISTVLERDGVMKRLKPIPSQKVFNSKEFLKFYIDDLEKAPNEFRVKKVGVFDTETTDIYGYIISYAFVIQDMDSLETKEIYELLNPKAKISEEAYEVHKIKQEDLEDKPTFEEKKEYILDLFNSVDMIVGHNVFFDFGVLKRELERAKHFPNIIEVPIFDTMFYSWDIVVLDKKKQPRLEEAVAFFLGPQKAQYHNALEDVKMTLKVFNRLLEEGKKL
ncbi:3'-5' exonuclease [Caminibacter mediatlanticus]|uniref:DNA polymerase III, epsilon chain n=1 Tax=Caminibacter mediatlanticus TB-2 TaxID=391592 RepID=A0AAI9AH52_9BACT|nr:3'-5' exonuclease [Caminibacter mediatlanticus]EDM23415.1 DNA polymerase III, epsilon chain [Caminibacter mediatlanticus TB-2]